MTAGELIMLLPFIAIATSALAVILVAAFFRCHSLTVTLTLMGTVLSFIAIIFIYPMAPRQVTALLVLDHYALFYSGLILAASFVVTALSYGYLELQRADREEFYFLLLLAALGSMVIVSSSHFASLFLGLEILSVSLYALLSYLRNREKSIEAGIKYLMLAAASAAFLVFGMALIYAQHGTMSFAQIAANAATDGHSALLLTGTAMIIVGVGFKLAVVPFHLWTPDVYEGAPAPVTAFVATVSKGAMFALVLRYFSQADFSSYGSLSLTFSLISIASMLAGNLLALLQNNVKRILAYSSIAHMGYLLVAFQADNSLVVTAVTYYLIAYFVTTLGAFGVITVLSVSEKDAEDIDDYRGMARRRPWLAAVLTGMLLSLAGIPLTAGFIGKFYIVAAGAGSALWPQLLVLAVSSSIGLFYYLRVVIAMYRQPVEEEAPKVLSRVSVSGGAVLAALAVAVVWFGVYPAHLLEMIRKMISHIT